MFIESVLSWQHKTYVHTYLQNIICCHSKQKCVEHSTCSDMALSMQHQQRSTGSRSPYHSYKFCLLTSLRADSPVVALDKSWPVQASNSIEAGWPVILHLAFIILSLSSGRPPLKLILFKIFLAHDRAGKPFWRCVPKLWIIFGEIHLHVETWVMF
jgi:hypothetical protein